MSTEWRYDRELQVWKREDGKMVLPCGFGMIDMENEDIAKEMEEVLIKTYGEEELERRAIKHRYDELVKMRRELEKRELNRKKRVRLKPIEKIKPIEKEKKRRWRKAIPKQIKETVRARGNHKCEICGTTEWLQIHHIKPRSRGGLDTLDNLVLLCEKCHYEIHKDEPVAKLMKSNMEKKCQ